MNTMKRFKCYLCFSEFHEESSTLKHLRKSHEVKEKHGAIKCITKNAKCAKTFQTWSGLKNHLKTCVKSVNEFTSDENQDFGTDDNGSISYDETITRSNILPSKISVIYKNDDNNNIFDSECEEIEPTESKKTIKTRDETNFHSQMVEQIQCFASRVESFGVAQNVKDSIFELTENLLKDVYEFNCASVNHNKNPHDNGIAEILNVAQNDVLNEIQKYNTVYKRNKICEENELYVKPEEKAIGTHWESRKDRQTKKSYPVHVQSILQYVPITKTLKSLFQQKHFRKLYYEYNAEAFGNKHKCDDHNYKDFCCGHVYKRNRLFKEHPESIQLQIFNDGFEMCDALKSKSNLHSQTAFYFTIRNLPPELAFNLANIHLVVLCNSNDLKSEQTDYNNIWQLIVDDLLDLERTGIDIGDGTKLRGIPNEDSLGLYCNICLSLCDVRCTSTSCTYILRFST